MKTIIGLFILAGVLLLGTGCVASMQNTLRSKLPAFQAATFVVTLNVVGEGGGSISGKGVVCDGQGHLTADEYHEEINTAFGVWKLDSTGAAVGTLQPLPPSPPAATVSIKPAIP